MLLQPRRRRERLLAAVVRRHAPGRLRRSGRDEDDAEGIETDTWTAKAPSGEAVVVSVSTMPAQIADPAKLIDSTRDSLLASVKGTLESEQPLPGAMPARRILFRTGGADLRSRLVVSGDRLYQLLYVGRSEQQRGAAEVGQMFDSFRITAPALTAGPAH